MISKFLQVYFPPPLPMFNYILMKYVCIFCILIPSHKTIPNCSHCSNTNTSQAYNNNYIPCLLYQLTQNNELNKNEVNLIYLKKIVEQIRLCPTHCCKSITKYSNQSTLKKYFLGGFYTYIIRRSNFNEVYETKSNFLNNNSWRSSIRSNIMW